MCPNLHYAHALVSSQSSFLPNGLWGVSERPTGASRADALFISAEITLTSTHVTHVAHVGVFLATVAAVYAKAFVRFSVRMS